MESINELKASISDYENYKDVFEILVSYSAAKFEKHLKYFKEYFDYFKHLQKINKSLISILELKPENHQLPKQINIVIGSNLPFCGDFNFNLKKYFLNFEKEDKSLLIIVGKQIEKLGLIKDAIYFPFPENVDNIDTVNSVYNKIIELNGNSLMTFVNIFFNKYWLPSFETDELKSINKSTNFINVERLFIPLLSLNYLEQKFSNIKNFYLEELFITKNGEKIFFNPGVGIFLNDFNLYSLRNFIYFGFLSSIVAENYSRMITMSFAKDEAERKIKILKQQLNKKRQMKITKELTELMNNFQYFQ